MKYISQTENDMFEALTNINPKPTAYSGQELNFLALDDRIFEILLYQIFKARIENNDFTLAERYDNVVLMQGVGERGRDCFLTKNGKNVGVIQCKKLNKNLNKTDVLKEILKFLIHYTQDKSLITDIEKFDYYFAVSKGFAETASVLLANFNDSYDEEEVKRNCEKILSSYSSLREVSYQEIEETIKNAIKKIRVYTLKPADLNQYLFEHPKLIKNFFRILTVTDNTLLEGIIDNYLAPILSKLYPKGNKDYKDFTFRFKEYLQRVYSYYSSSRTLVFGNHQKKLEDFYYPLNVECIIDLEKGKRLSISTSKFEDDFLPKFKKIIIIDDGGMGKSTIMKWLFLSIIKEGKGIPIFIELRKLINGRTVLDEIVQELNPIDKQLERDIVTKLIEQGNFIFFFDGYDEITDIDRSFVTTDLQNFISKSGNNLFIMTSRPETALNTFSDFREFKIKNLEEKEAFELIKKIGNNSDKSQRLIKKIEEKKIQNINAFLRSPLLVSLLYKKFEHRENIPLNIQEFYYEIFEALFQDHDLTKGDSYIRPKKSKLSFSEFFQILRTFSFFTLKKGEVIYNDALINKYLNEISKTLPNIEFNIPDFIEDLVKNVPLFNKEGLQYRWAHKSFQEYFSAEFICRDTKEKQIEILRSMHVSEKFERYIFILDLCYDIDFNSFQEAILIPYVKGYLEFCNDIFKDIVINKNIRNEQIALRKGLLFNSSYLFRFKKNDLDKSYMKEAIDFFKTENGINRDVFVETKFKEYEILSITVSMSMMSIVSRKFNDIIEILVNKKSPILSYHDFKKNRDLDKILEKGNMRKDCLINDKFNDLSDCTEFEFHNKLMISLRDDLQGWVLDFQKCEKYLKEYERYRIKKNENDLISGI
ncbi:NACHT domain-containing protein [Sphingobacterium sp. UGAL515B_05]|uniref:NACHT domain-containing protein n=1 Tax=Sphingobacterium sp. UGAL515B_05 TaxID=2986767 RepID=UPI0029558F8D|nr:NACHT domain-containing protein [Sphingobacterium sp. UGAL515B_05]WON95062.1 NACHT domain-containing protein [Sphingobacterium sp. UGAL515B_05]